MSAPEIVDPSITEPGPLRVLLIVTRLELGGAQQVVLDTAAGLDRQIFEVGLAWGPGEILDDRARQIEGLRRFEIDDLVRPVAPRRDLRALRALRSAIRDFRPDVVHTHSSKAGVLGRLAAHLEGGATVVHTIHGWGFTPLQSLPARAAFYAMERLASRWTDHFIAVSRVNRQHGLELGLFDAGRCSVIRAGIEIDRFRRAVDDGRTRRRLELPDGAPIVVQVGNFKPQKAPLDFVRMAARVASDRPDVRFVMVGDGPLRAEAEALARALGVDTRLRFAGWWDDVPGLLAASTLAVLSSRHEGLPCAVVEALAVGVPVVATAVDGVPEIVHSGRNGLLVPPGNVPALAVAVGRLLADDELRLRLAAAAPRDLAEFDRDTMVRQQEDLYRCLVGSSRS